MPAVDDAEAALADVARRRGTGRRAPGPTRPNGSPGPRGNDTSARDRRDEPAHGSPGSVNGPAVEDDADARDAGRCCSNGCDQMASYSRLGPTPKWPSEERARTPTRRRPRRRGTTASPLGLREVRGRRDQVAAADPELRRGAPSPRARGIEQRRAGTPRRGHRRRPRSSASRALRKLRAARTRSRS